MTRSIFFKTRLFSALHGMRSVYVPHEFMWEYSRCYDDAFVRCEERSRFVFAFTVSSIARLMDRFCGFDIFDMVLIDICCRCCCCSSVRRLWFRHRKKK
jgi:hypothetical protein